MYTVFHSYKDDELIRYALSTIHHPAVQEICFRLSNVSTELDEIDDLNEVQKELEESERRIADLENDVAGLEEEISNLEYEIERLTQELKEAHNELA